MPDGAIYRTSQIVAMILVVKVKITTQLKIL